MAMHTPLVDVKGGVRQMVERTITILKDGASTQIDLGVLNACFEFVQYMKHGIAIRGTWAPPLRGFTDKERAEVQEIEHQYAEVMAVFNRACEKVYEDIPRAIAAAFIINGLRRAEICRPAPKQAIQFFEKVHEYLSKDWVHVEEAETSSDA